MLRQNGVSYVCDVNGWSFVKGSHKYYDDSAKILRQMFLDGFMNKGFQLINPVPGKKELRGMVCVLRHADRTPKQKVKIRVWNKDLLNFFEDPHTEVKLKNDSNQVKLSKMLAIVKGIMEMGEAQRTYVALSSNILQ